MQLTLGIDDAGRGPVIGPMILAGCLINPKAEKELKKLGVRDSKQLTHKRREFLEKKIKNIAETFEVIIIHPDKIDQSQEQGTKLNELEAHAVARIINRINKAPYNKEKIKVVIDCPSTSISKWSDYLKQKIKDLSTLEISCEHKADKNSTAVSAASILAKCVREREIQKLKETYGDELGSGYTSDPLTIKFLEKYAAKHKDAGIFRKCWVTWQRAYDNLKQRKLSF